MPLFLAPFFAAISGSIGWAMRVAVPMIIGSLFSTLLFRVGLYVIWLIAVMAAVNKMLEMAAGYMGGLPADLIQIMTMTGLVNAMNIIASAYLFKLTLKMDFVKLLSSKAA